MLAELRTRIWTQTDARWTRLIGAVWIFASAVLLALTSVPLTAIAQYRAGDFIDGQPSFGRFASKKSQPGYRARQPQSSISSRARRRRDQQRVVRRKAKPRLVRRVAEAVGGDAGGSRLRLTVTTPKLPAKRLLGGLGTSAPAGGQPDTSIVAMVLPAQRSATKSGTQGLAVGEAVNKAIDGKSADQRMPLPTKSILRKRNKVMQIVISLRNQKLTVYQNDIPVSRSPVSTGKAGHRTPTGIFSIIQKNRFHRSNIYSGAPMPFMQRITWSGIAMHMGSLPGYPASHGCVRLPGHFALNLFKSTEMRSHVVIADDSLVPRWFSHPNLPGVSDLEGRQLVRLPPPGQIKLPDQTGGENSSELVSPSNVTLANWGSDSRRASSANTTVGRRMGLADPLTHQLATLLHFDQTEQLAHRRQVVRARSEAPLRILVTRRRHADKTRDLQRQLLSFGYDVGEVDGLIGPRMIAATKAFQQDHGLRETGLADEATRETLSRRSGRSMPADAEVYVRQNGREVYAGPVELVQPEVPLGTHLYTMVDFKEGSRAGNWLAMTVQDKGRLPEWTEAEWRKRVPEITAMDSVQAISRVTFPEYVRQTIEDRLTPGSSLIVADGGSDRETGVMTDFIVLTD